MGEAEVDEPLQVDGGDAVAEPEPVAVGAVVAESAVGADEPGDAAFDHGPVLAVGDVELVGLGEGAGSGEQAMVGVQRDDPPVVGGGAALSVRSVTGKPLLARMRNPEVTAMEPAGTACALYAAAFEEIASLYLGRKANVAQTQCATNGGGYCEWRLEPN